MIVCPAEQSGRRNALFIAREGFFFFSFLLTARDCLSFDVVSHADISKVGVRSFVKNVTGSQSATKAASIKSST